MGLAENAEPKVDVKLYFNDEVAPLEIKGIENVSELKDATFTVPYTDLLAKNLNPLSLQSCAKDEFGNESEIYSTEVNLDIKNPELLGDVQWKVLNSNDAMKANAGSQLWLEFTLSKAIEGKPLVQLFLKKFDDVKTETLPGESITKKNGNTWTVNFDVPTAMNDSELLFGSENKVIIKVSDPQGNSEVFEQSLPGLEVDNFPPQLIVSDGGTHVEINSTKMTLNVKIVDKGLFSTQLKN